MGQDEGNTQVYVGTKDLSVPQMIKSWLSTWLRKSGPLSLEDFSVDPFSVRVSNRKYMVTL